MTSGRLIRDESHLMGRGDNARIFLLARDDEVQDEIQVALILLEFLQELAITVLKTHLFQDVELDLILFAQGSKFLLLELFAELFLLIRRTVVFGRRADGDLATDSV